MALKLIIFDLDGTLVDTLPDITRALNRALSGSGLRPLRMEKVKGMVGEGITRLIEKASPPAAEGPLREKILASFLMEYERGLLENSRPFPGVPETLQELRGFKKAVISNKRRVFSVKVLEGLGLLGHFEMVIGPETVGERKPSPAPYLHVLRGCGAAPGEVIGVGDSPLDIEGCRGAGLSACVAVTYGYNPREALAGADFLIDRIESLPDIVRKEL